MMAHNAIPRKLSCETLQASNPFAAGIRAVADPGRPRTQSPSFLTVCAEAEKMQMAGADFSGCDEVKQMPM
jgi:hypothetical protein